MTKTNKLYRIYHKDFRGVETESIITWGKDPMTFEQSKEFIDHANRIADAQGYYMKEAKNG